MFDSYLKFATVTTQITAFFVLLLMLVVNLTALLIPDGNGYPLYWLLFLSLAVIAWVGYKKYYSSLSHQLHAFFLNESNKQAKLLDECNNQVRYRAIIIAAALSLFFELVMIRWQGTLFPVFAMYKNFTLLACFAGLGAGYAMARLPQIPLLLVAPLTAIMFSLFMMLRYGSGPLTNIFFMLPIREETSVFFNFGDALNFSTYFLSLMFLHGLLISSFFFTALIFFPIGQVCGRLMAGLPNTKAYGLNLLGSILGTLILVFMSYMWMSPALWMVVVMLGLFYFLRESKEGLFVGAISTLVIVTAISWPAEPYVHQIYSPYQLIERTATKEGLMQILAAGKYYQKVYDFSASQKSKDLDPELLKIAQYYELPYTFFPTLDRVAIVGAGSGNDVAAAIRMGVKQIDAIEIDPVIQYLGEYYHPEHPYANQRVRTFIDDARTFFHKANSGYDLIVYGVLDSHTLLSHASNVRIDSFVYTQEGLRDAFALLREGGMMALSFCLPHDILGYKIYRMMENLPNAGKPIALRTGYDKDSTTTFIVKKGGDIPLNSAFLNQTEFENLTSHFAQLKENVDIPTDDWPFFYMPKRVYPTTSLIALGLMLVLSYFFVKHMTDVNFAKFNAAYLPAFFMGAGFMLVETKAITEFGLWFGNTWIVLAIVIVSILIMAYFANLLTSRYQFKRINIIFALLLLSLSLGYYTATHGKFSGLSPSWYFLIVILLTCPLFFSGLVFSRFLQKAGADITHLMAYNLLGALIGVLLEYNAMYFGFAFLYLLAIALYFMAWLTWRVDLTKVLG